MCDMFLVCNVILPWQPPVSFIDEMSVIIGALKNASIIVIGA